MKKEYMTLKEMFDFIEKSQKIGFTDYFVSEYMYCEKIETEVIGVLTDFFNDKIDTQFGMNLSPVSLLKKNKVKILLSSVFSEKNAYDCVHIIYFFGKNNVLLYCYDIQNDKKYRHKIKLICPIDILDKVLKEWLSNYTILKDKNGKEYKKYGSSIDFFNKIKLLKNIKGRY